MISLARIGLWELIAALYKISNQKNINKRKQIKNHREWTRNIRWKSRDNNANKPIENNQHEGSAEESTDEGQGFAELLKEQRVSAPKFQQTSEHWREK